MPEYQCQCQCRYGRGGGLERGARQKGGIHDAGSVRRIIQVDLGKCPSSPVSCVSDTSLQVALAVLMLLILCSVYRALAHGNPYRGQIASSSLLRLKIHPEARITLT